MRKHRCQVSVLYVKLGISKMIHQKKKKGSRALWAVAFAAAPVGAYASPITNLPMHSCNSDGQLDRISWQNESNQVKNGSSNETYVGSKNTVLGVTVRGLETKGGDTVTVPFDCVQTTKGGIGGSLTGSKMHGANVFATAGLTKGESFSIDFGPLYQTDSQIKGGGESKTKIDFDPTFTAFAYETLKDSKGQQEWVTDFNLDLEAIEPGTKSDVLFQDFLGVQVISGESELYSKNLLFFNDLGQLIFDPAIDGGTTVNLYSSPLSPPAVPEPASLALIVAGLIGMAAFGRRKKDESDGGEPGA